MANLFMAFTTPYLPAQAGLTVEAWPASDFVRSPVGNAGAYPPSGSPAASTTTAAGGTAELTGLTAGHGYYVSIIDINGKPWFFTAPAGILGNTALTARAWSFNPAPSAAAPAPAASNFGPIFQTGSFGTISLGSSPSNLGWNPGDFNLDTGNFNGTTYTIPRNGIYEVTIVMMFNLTSTTSGNTRILLADGYVGAGGGSAVAKLAVATLPPWPGGPGQGLSMLTTALYKCAAGDTFTPEALSSSPGEAEGANEGTISVLGPLP